MKLLFATMVLFYGVQHTCAQTIEAGMLLADAAAILEAAGSTSQERHLDTELADGLSVAYFPIEELVDLCLVYENSTKRIRGLSITFYPRYRPVKGLEVTKELVSFAFEEVGAYSIVVRKAEQVAGAVGVPPQHSQ